MMSEKYLERFAAVLAAVIFIGLLVLAISTSHAEQPPCVGDRHENCSGTTPTTLPDVAPNADVKECLCQCPTVTCDGSTPIVSVPTYYPRYRPCRYTKTGKLHCPHPHAPRRVLVPEVGGTLQVDSAEGAHLN